MMYTGNKLVVAIKANGKVLRENKDVVYVPFGTEYTILIKNLNTVRASVSIDIDGTCATDQTKLIINANDEIEVTRFIKNGNLESGNRFKFIERTSTVEQHRGVGAEDGIVRVEFEFEQEPLPYVGWDNWKRSYIAEPWPGSTGDVRFNGGYSTSDVMYKSAALGNSSPQLMNMAVASCAAPINDAGITVPGSVSDQKFKVTSAVRGDGVKHVLVLRLLGEAPNGQAVTKPITVDIKPKCVTCGKTNKSNAKFCSECGTSLQIV